MLGTRLRERRNEMEMSIKDLAEKTGLTSGFISQIERGLAEPSITSLRNIANELGVPVFYFLLDDIEENPVVRKDQRRILNFGKSDLTYELLSPDLNKQMEMFLGKLNPGTDTGEEFLYHTGEEVIHILKGTMWFKLGTDEYILETGDTVQFNSSKLHQIKNIGEEVLEFISTTTPPPELDSCVPRK